MTQIIREVGVSWKHGNRIGFQSRSFKGHMLDFKMVCARFDRMDLWKRFLEIKERSPISHHAMRSIARTSERQHFDSLASYLETIANTTSLSEVDRFRAKKMNDNIGRSTLSTKGCSSKKTREKLLNSLDEPWMTELEDE